MNKTIKRFSIAVAIFLLSLVPFQTNFSQTQNQLIKPCMAETTTPQKKEVTTNRRKKKGRKGQKSKDGGKDQQQAKGSNCN
jgi:hypothetical protein